MTPAEALREFIQQRLTAAAGEIFTEFQKTIIQYEKQMNHQDRLLEITGELPVPVCRTESPQQHRRNQKTSSSGKQEEHEAPHSREEEHLVEISVTDGGSEDSHRSVRDSTTRRLTAAAVEIFNLFQQTIAQYQEKIDRRHRLLDVVFKPQIKLHRIKFKKRRDCRKQQETNHLLKQEEPGPRKIKEEPEAPGPPRIKKEPKEPGPPQIKEEPEEPGLLQHPEEQEEPGSPETEEHQDLGSSQTGARPVATFESETLKVPSVEEQSDLSDPEEEPDTERLLSQDSEVHRENKLTDFPVSEKQAECEETCSEPVRKKPKRCRKVRRVTDKNKTCDTCRKSFTRHSYLLVHMRSHTGENLYSCDTCGRSFTTPCNLLRHMRIHTGEKPYSCEICGKSFSYHSYLSVHMKIHTGKNLYSCETCGKRFIAQSNLLVHMRIHTGEKPYSCETCGRSFINKSNLLGHMRTHTGEKPFFCDTCGMRFSHRSSLLHHLKSHK